MRFLIWPYAGTRPRLRRATMRYTRFRRTFTKITDRPSRVLMALAAMLVFGLVAVAGCSSTAPQQQEGGCPYPTCNGYCVDWANNPFNCGGCNVQCGTGMGCVAGLCQCAGGLATCPAGCVDTAIDAANCGSCNNACAVGSLCSV